MHTRRLLLKRTIAAGIGVALIGVASLGGTTRVHAAPLAAAAPLSLDYFVIEPKGLSARVQAAATEPTTVSYSLKRVDLNGGGPTLPPRRPLADVVARSPIGVLSTGGTPPTPVYERRHDLNLTNLTSNTLYEVTLRVSAADGQSVTKTERFTTYKERVKVTLDKIVVSDDGDWIGKGELMWGWRVDWVRDVVSGCYPFNGQTCTEANVSEGTIFPRTRSGDRFEVVFAEENFKPVPQPNPHPGEEDFTAMPQSLRLIADAVEFDQIQTGSPQVLNDGGTEYTWQVPQNTESAVQSLSLRVKANGSDSTMYFTFVLTHDNRTYAPNSGRVYVNWK